MTSTGAVNLAGLCLVGLAALADTAPILSPTSSGIIALNSLPNPSTTLATASCGGRQGHHGGRGAEDRPGCQRQAPTVDVALMGSNAVVAMDASQFNYDQGHNVLTAQLDAQPDRRTSRRAPKADPRPRIIHPAGPRV